MRCKAVFAAAAITFLAASAQAQEAVTPSDGKPRKAAVATDASAGWDFVWKEHPSLRFGDLLRLELHARVAADVRRSQIVIDDESSELDLARRRLGIEGRLANFADFQIEREVSGDNLWRDVFANVRRFRSLQLKAGRFKLPFSLDETTGAAGLDFVYRSRAATVLAPGRDSGVMAHGQLLAHRLSYEAGVFAHDGDNSRSQSHPDRVSGGRTTAVRLQAQPFRRGRSLLKELAVGGAYTVSEVPDGILAVHGKTSFDQSFFPADFWVNGRRTRSGAELRWRGGPLSVASEYIRFANQRSGESIRGENLPTFVATGWYVSGVWTVVNAAPNEPARLQLLPPNFGRVDAAARLERLAFGSVDGVASASTSPRAESLLRNSDTILTFGLNWYVNRWFSVRANLIRDSILRPELAPEPARPSYWSRAIRFEFAL